LKMMLYKRQLEPKRDYGASEVGDPMKTQYADAYRQLIQICRTNNIRLVLSTYSMAVNERSTPEVFEFYHMQVPSLSWKLKANVLHTRIVKRFAELNPDIVFVDTQPGLDGEAENFIDPIHFAPEGDQKMAEAFFAGIEGVLKQSLSLANSKDSATNQSFLPSQH